MACACVWGACLAFDTPTDLGKDLRKLCASPCQCRAWEGTSQKAGLRSGAREISIKIHLLPSLPRQVREDEHGPRETFKNTAKGFAHFLLANELCNGDSSAVSASRSGRDFCKIPQINRVDKAPRVSQLVFRTVNQELGSPNANNDYIAKRFRDKLMPIR